MPSRPSSVKATKLLEPFWREEVLRQVLPNGLTLVAKPDFSAELVSVQVWVKTGSLHEDRLLGAGISHFLEHMLFKGTEKRSGRQISAEVQAHGGYINAYTTFDRTVYYIDLPSEHVDLAVDMLADCVLSPTLPADEVEREREVILREIAMTRDDPDQRLWEGLFETAFRAHPYRYPIIGHKDLFVGLTREDLVAYHRSRYVPNNIVVVVAGAVEPERVSELVTRSFGAFPRSRLAPVLIPEEPVQLASRDLHRREDVEVSRAILAWRIPGLEHADAPLLDLLSTVLGSGDSSILWRKIREEAGLVHSIDASCWNPGATGLFSVCFTCEPERREAAVRAVQAELAACAKKGFTQAQIDKALRQLAVGEINTRKTMSGQASRLGVAEVVAGDLQFSRGFFEKLGQAKPEDLKRLIRDYLVPRHLIEVSSSPVIKAETAPKAGRAGVKRADFEEILLPNGARLVLQEDHRIPNLHFRLVCGGGPLFEAPGKRGATALLATLLTKDSTLHSAEEIASYIEEVGGSFYPFSGNNSLGLAVEVLPTDVDRALRVLREGAFKPAFRKATFEKEREAQLAELKLDDDDIVALGRRRLRSRFFGGYPLSLDAHGDEAGVSALDTKDIRALHASLFRAGNLVLAVSGAFNKKELLPKLRKLMAEAPKGAVPSPKVLFKAPAAQSRSETMKREQAVVFHAYPGPTLLHPDFYVGEVADELFSGMASKLFERVREEKGLAYFVRSSRVTGLGAGMFYFFAGTAPEKAGEVLRELELEVERVAAGGVEQAEIDRCIARLKAGRRQGMQTAASRALNAGLNVLFGLPANDWRHYDERISAVGRGELAAFASKYLAASGRVELIVGPTP